MATAVYTKVMCRRILILVRSFPIHKSTRISSQSNEHWRQKLSCFLLKLNSLKDLTIVRREICFHSSSVKSLQCLFNHQFLEMCKNLYFEHINNVVRLMNGCKHASFQWNLCRPPCKVATCGARFV